MVMVCGHGVKHVQGEGKGKWRQKMMGLGCATASFSSK